MYGQERRCNNVNAKEKFRSIKKTYPETIMKSKESETQS